MYINTNNPKDLENCRVTAELKKLLPRNTLPILEELPKWKVLKGIIYEIFEEIDPIKRKIKKELDPLKQKIKLEIKDEEEEEADEEQDEEIKLRSVRERYKEFKDPGKS